jgi:hypothetical protein
MKDRKKMICGQCPASVATMRKMRPGVKRCWNCRNSWWEDDGAVVTGYCFMRDICFSLNIDGVVVYDKDDQPVCEEDCNFYKKPYSVREIQCHR